MKRKKKKKKNVQADLMTSDENPTGTNLKGPGVGSRIYLFT